MEYSSSHKSEIINMLADVDKKTIARGNNPAVTDSFAIEYNVRPLPEKVKIKTYEAEIGSDVNGRRNYIRTDRQKDVLVPYYIDYYPVKKIKFPYAYIITTRDPAITDLLKIHGIKIEELSADTKIEVLRFETSDLQGASRSNQGHYTNTINGKYISGPIDFPSGSIVVRTAQPLGNLIAYLLEPQSNDGLIFWNYFDRYLVPQWGTGFNPVPVYKVMDRVELNTVKRR
jgi:hypothetical protein